MSAALSDSMRRPLQDRLIVALDRPDLGAALEDVERIGDAVKWYKVGLQLFCAAGRPAVAALAERGKNVFLDLKLHDIPAAPFVRGAIDDRFSFSFPHEVHDAALAMLLAAVAARGNLLNEENQRPVAAVCQRGVQIPAHDPLWV